MNIHILNNMENVELEKALLGFLLKGPKHGYELFKEISNPMGVGGVWRVKIGKMYSLLKKLESKQLIRANSQQDGNRPPKNTYFLTTQGEKSFKEWMRTPIKHGRDLRVLFLLKIYFIKKNGLLNGNDLILNQKAECENWKKRYVPVLKNRNYKKSFNMFVRKYRLSQINGFINWLDWCGEAISEEI